MQAERCIHNKQINLFKKFKTKFLALLEFFVCGREDERGHQKWLVSLTDEKSPGLLVVAVALGYPL